MEHFNQAAHSLHVSEPSLSRSIRMLEEELGITLFEKRGRNVTLTKAGRIFLGHVEKILDDIHRAEINLNEYAINGGRISIAYISPVTTEIMPSMIHDFLQKEENKRVSFDFIEGYTENNYIGLKNGTFDLIFGTNMSEEPGIELIPIFKTKLVVVIPKGHPLESEDYINHNVFNQYPVLKYDKKSSLGVYTDQYFSAYNVVPDITFEFPDEQSIASFVSKNFGIALVADVPAIHRNGVIIKEMVENEQLYQTISIAYLKNTNHSPATLRLIEFIKENYKKSE